MDDLVRVINPLTKQEIIVLVRERAEKYIRDAKFLKNTDLTIKELKNVRQVHHSRRKA